MRWLTWSGLGRFSDIGHFVLRAGVGAMMMFHGWPKVAGGADKWTKLGHAVGVLGIDFAPLFFGACAAFGEFVGGACLVLGFATRPASATLAFTMLVAALHHLDRGDGIGGAAHAMTNGIVFLGLLFQGGGRYSVDHRLG